MYYTIKELNEYQLTPQGLWYLVSENRLEVIGTFYDDSFLVVGSIPQGNSELTLKIAA